MKPERTSTKLSTLQSWVVSLLGLNSAGEQVAGADATPYGGSSTESSGSERRRHPRVAATGLQSCLLIDDRLCDGRLKDISLGGAQFRGQGKAPAPGAEVRVVSPAPMPREVHGRVLSVDAGWRDITLHIEWHPDTSREAVGIMITHAQRITTPSTIE